MNPARPAPGALLARLEELPDPGAVCLDFAAGEARFSLILARRGAVAFAYENRCPHARFPLEKPNGDVILQDGRYLVCAAHGASFTADTGACVGGPGDGTGLTPLPLRMEGGLIRMGG